ncbi:MAG: ABC transporter ATP-binding protein/permease [Lachnospiraceae bacterium]|nr:ABC transporter ATP-binding protein/permease [Lachnospiraceae bacterium]
MKRKIQSFLGLYRFFQLCWKNDKIYVLHLFLLQIYTAASGILVVMVPQRIIDATFIAQDLREALTIAIVFSVGILGLNVLMALSNRMIMSHRMIIYKKFQLSISNMMMHIDFKDLESEHFLDIKAKAERFLFGDGRGFGYVLESGFGIISQLVTLLVMAGVVVHLNPVILITLVVILVINARVNTATQQKNIRINQEKAVYERTSNYYSHVAQDFRYGKDIRNYGASGWILGRYENLLDGMQEFYERMAVNGFCYETAVSLTSMVQQAISYLYVVYCGVMKLITVGQFSMYLSAISSFSSTLKSLTGTIIAMQQYTQYYEDYDTYMSYQRRVDTGKAVGAFTHRIVFEHVSFRYPGQARNALTDINFEITAGEKLLIVGENGAGKSTLIKLLLRLYVPTEGRILLDGMDINEMSIQEYNRLFATVFQDYNLFACPITENVAMGQDYDKNKIKEIMELLHLDGKIAKLPKGVETNLYKEFDEHGFTPSGGEGQKIAIARAIYRNAPIVVMDEPTAALDPRAEEELYQMLESVFADKTAIFISHRLSTASMCDRIISLKDGNIIENDTHENLIQEDGLYSNLYRMQSERYAI